jgi:gliding motility-associated protein GldL
MSRKKGGFTELLFRTIMPKVYGIGAAVVIVGAMFKILHLPGASEMLGIGLTVEAIIFFLSAFEPPHDEPDWTKVYPELSDDFDGAPSSSKKTTGGSGVSVTKKLDEMFDQAKVEPAMIENLGKGMRSLTENIGKMASLSNAAVATEEYSKNVKDASKALIDMNKSYSTTVSAMAEMANASKDAKEYHVQVQAVTKNLSSLNAVYEMELQDTNRHLKSMNKFYSNLSAAMENMAQASKETDSFKGELSKLTTNLTSLNKVYGSMLAAMKS